MNRILAVLIEIAATHVVVVGENNLPNRQRLTVRVSHPTRYMNIPATARNGREENGQEQEEPTSGKIHSDYRTKGDRLYLTNDHSPDVDAGASASIASVKFLIVPFTVTGSNGL